MNKIGIPACNYNPEENDDKFIEIEGSSLHIRTKLSKTKTITLIACPNCMNVFME